MMPQYRLTLYHFADGKHAGQDTFVVTATDTTQARYAAKIEYIRRLGTSLPMHEVGVACCEPYAGIVLSDMGVKAVMG